MLFFSTCTTRPDVTVFDGCILLSSRIGIASHSIASHHVMLLPVYVRSGFTGTGFHVFIRGLSPGGFFNSSIMTTGRWLSWAPMVGTFTAFASSEELTMACLAAIFLCFEVWISLLFHGRSSLLTAMSAMSCTVSILKQEHHADTQTVIFCLPHKQYETTALIPSDSCIRHPDYNTCAQRAGIQNLEALGGIFRGLSDFQIYLEPRACRRGHDHTEPRQPAGDLTRQTGGHRG
ncbi:hypothetical protein V8F06_000400 [Rhypophila decipiens]